MRRRLPLPRRQRQDRDPYRRRGVAFPAAEPLERRALLSAQADITQLSALRNDPAFAGVDGSGVGVAVIGTGLFADHPDLVGNLAGYFDAVSFPADAVGSGDPSLAPVDPGGHGTHAAGVVAASNPEIGVATAADLVAVRGVPSPGDATPLFDPLANALEWVRLNHRRFNIKVVVLPPGDAASNVTGAASDARRSAFDELHRLGITTVVGSGDDYAHFAAPGATALSALATFGVANTWPDAGAGETFPQYGGGFARTNFIAGEADAAPDRLAASSQRGTLPNQLAAPGSGIVSTWNDPAKPYNALSGTAVSAAFVAGAVALAQDAALTYGGRYLTTAEVQSILLGSADAIVDAEVASNSREPVSLDEAGRSVRSGPDEGLPETGLTLKRVNVYRAVQAVRQAVTATAPDPSGTAPSAIPVPALDGTQRFAFTGSVGADGAVAVGPADVDLFRIVLESPGALTVATDPTVGGTPFDAYLRLFNESGTEIAAADNSGDNPYQLLQSGRLPPGSYSVGVSGAGNAAYDIATGAGATAAAAGGDYSLALSLSNPDRDGVAAGARHVDLASPRRLGPNTGLPAGYFAGRIGDDPDPFNPGSRLTIGDADVDLFRVVAPDTGVLVVDVDSRDATAGPAPYPDTGVNTFVRLFDAKLNVLDENDDEAPGELTDSYVEVSVTEGAVYYVAVTTPGAAAFGPADPFDRSSTTPGVAGEYDLYLSFDNFDLNGSPLEALPVIPGEPLDGQVGLDEDEPVGNGGARDVDFFEFAGDGATAGLLDVTVSSPDGSLDPVVALWFFDPDRNDVVRIQRAAGGGSRLIVPLGPDDVYYVSVTGRGNGDSHWSAPASGSGGDTGNYTLVSRLRPQNDLAALADNAVQGGNPADVAPGQRLFGTVGADGAVAVGAADVDLYRFAPAASGIFSISASVAGGQATDPVLRVFDDAGNEVAFADDANVSTRDAALSFTADAGRVYYIGVNGNGDAARSYNPLTGAGAAAGDGGDYVLAVSNAAVTFDARRRATYTDAGGDLVVVSMKGPGSGTLHFAGAAGGNADAAGLTLDGTTAATSVVIKSRGVGTTVGDLTVNGSLKGLAGRTTDLAGNLTATGSVGRLALRSAGGGKTITYAGAGAPATFTFGSVADLSIASAAPIRSLKVTQWLDADATPDAITAPSVDSIVTRGEFGAGVTADTLRRARFGSLAGSDVRAATAVGTISAGSMTNSRVFAGVQTGATDLPASMAEFANPSASIGSVSVKGLFDSSRVAAPSVGRLSLGSVSRVVAPDLAPYGVAADRIRSVVVRAPRLRLTRLDDPAALDVTPAFVRLL